MWVSTRFRSSSTGPFMDERKIERHEGMARVADDMATLVARLGSIAPPANLGTGNAISKRVFRTEKPPRQRFCLAHWLLGSPTKEMP